MAVASVLNKSGLLIEDHYENILDGICTCSLPSFARIFENIKANGYTQGIAGTQQGLVGMTVYKRIEYLFNIAEARYKKLSSSDEWPAKGEHASDFNVTFAKCYNCGGNHLLPDCKENLDNEKIATNHKKTNEAQREGERGNGGRGGRGHGRGRGNPTGRGGGLYDLKGHYHRPGPGEHTRVVDAKLLYPCGTCGCNLSHSSAYHAQQMSNPATFTMSTTTYPGKVAADGDAVALSLTASSATEPP